MTTPYQDQLPPYGPPPYAMPGNPDNSPPFPTIYPPPVQGLAVAYLTPRLTPIPVATRLPQPANTADCVNGFVRVEAAGGAVMVNELMFNVGLIIHSYGTYDAESMAEIVCMKALALAGNAQGRFITHPSLQRPWFVTYSRISSLAVKQNDARVPMVRFRASVTWRLQGSHDPINEPPVD